MAVVTGEVQGYQKEHVTFLDKQIDEDGVITIDEAIDGDTPVYIITVESA